MRTRLGSLLSISILGNLDSQTPVGEQVIRAHSSPFPTLSPHLTYARGCSRLRLLP